MSRGPAERRLSGYTLPPLSLLDPPKTERKIDERELMESARLLEEKCREFSVEGAVVQIHPGPVVTTFEFKPDAGVKYSKVTGTGRRSVPRHAGRVGADRAHPRQVDGRHSDSEPSTASRSHCASCSSPIPISGPRRSSRSRSARRFTASPTWRIWRRCRTCSSRGRRAPANRSG